MKNSNDSSDYDDNSDEDTNMDSSYDLNESDDEDTEKIDPMTMFTIKEKLYYRMINKFFNTCNPEDIEKMINIVEGKSIISLRVLDWFVTKYSKKKLDNNQTKDIEMFDVRISYKSQLKSYKKQYFDPFRRKRKYTHKFSNGLEMKTTLGQLNFFKWAFTNNIIAYVEKNLKNINNEIKTTNKNLEKDKKETKKNIKTKSKSPNNKKNVRAIKTKNDVNANIKLNINKIKENDIQLTLVFD